MDLRDYLRTLRKRWRLVVACTVLSLLAAGLATSLATKIYESKTQLFVSARDQAGDISGAYQGGLFTQQRVKSYAQVADSPAVTDPVADRLGLDPGVVAAEVTAEAPLDTVLINITVADSDPGRAQNLASAVADEVRRLVPELERAEGEAASPVKVTVIKAASLPAAPSSPRPMLNLALGLLAGLALGVGAAILRETLDTTVKGKDDLQEVTGSAPLGLIAFDPDAVQRPLVVQVDPQSPRAEAFRHLRTNLQFADVDSALKSLVVTSAVAGEGKSTTSCNLAITLAQAGIKTVLVEADLRRPKVAQYLGIEGAVGLTSVLTGAATLTDVLQPWGRIPLQVIASGPLPPNPAEILGSHLMQDLLKELEDVADIVVLDAPPLLPVTDAAVLARVTDGAVLVIAARHTKREQVGRSLEALAGVDARLLGTVLNKTPASGPDSDAYGYGYYSQDAGPSQPARRSSGRRGKRAHRPAGLRAKLRSGSDGRL